MAENDWWNTVPGPVRWLIVGALLSGAGNGVVGINKDASDRFKGADFAREINVRDAKIEWLRQQLEIHLRHSSKYTQVIEENQRQLERLERHLEGQH